LTTLILVLVVAVAAWSKLRFVGREGYDAPRWRVDEFSMPKAAPPAQGRGHTRGCRLPPMAPVFCPRC